MAQATIQDIPTLQTLPQQANCTACLTRDCPMAGTVNYPVQLCSSYRQANCYFCNQLDCVLQGSFTSPVTACNQFVPVSIA